MKKNILTVAITVVLNIILTWTTLSAQADGPDPFNPHSSSWERAKEKYHSFGLSGDRSHIAEMLPVLKISDPRAPKETVLLALARLGATEALPDVEALMLTPNDSGFAALARATRARILAQTEPTAQAQAARYFQEIGDTPEQLNTVLQKYNADLKQHLFMSPLPLREIHEEEELADMIYYGSSQELLADPLIAQVDFNLRFSIRIKIEMARLTPEQQRQTLVDRIANTRGNDDDEWHEAQILIDLGHAQAVQAATTKLQEMDANPQSYSVSGFLGLFEVLYASEDSTHSSLAWSHFQKHPDSKIRDVAKRVGFGYMNAEPGMIVNGY